MVGKRATSTMSGQRPPHPYRGKAISQTNGVSPVKNAHDSSTRECGWDSHATHPGVGFGTLKRPWAGRAACFLAYSWKAG